MQLRGVGPGRTRRAAATTLHKETKLRASDVSAAYGIIPNVDKRLKIASIDSIPANDHAVGLTR
jgi:hypothetical protein